MRLTTLTALGLAVAALAASPAQASNDIVISQIYGGGSGAIYKNDYVELFNRGTSTVNLAGYVLRQYRFDTGAESPGSPTGLAGDIPPGGYFLVAEASNSTGLNNLPTPDNTGTINLFTGSATIDLIKDAVVVDRVGYGTGAAVQPEGEAAPQGSSQRVLVRRLEGCQDTDSNAGDFALEEFSATRVPRNSASATTTCAYAPTIDCGAGTLTTTQGTAASLSIAASDEDAGIESIEMASSAPGDVLIDGFNRSGHAASALLLAGEDVPAGTYPLTLRATSVAQPETAECVVSLIVKPQASSGDGGGGGGGGAAPAPAATPVPAPVAPSTPAPSAPIALQLLTKRASARGLRLFVVNRGAAVRGTIALRIGSRSGKAKRIEVAEGNTVDVTVGLDRRSKGLLARGKTLRGTVELKVQSLDGTQRKTVKRRVTLRR